MMEPSPFIVISTGIVSFLANLLTIIASGIAIIIFFFNRKQISSAFKLLISYSYRITLSELTSKIEQLNEYNVNDEEQKGKVIELLCDIVGQIRGNKKFEVKYQKMLKKLSSYIDRPELLSQPRKRILVSELRERLRAFNLSDYDDLIGGKDE